MHGIARFIPVVFWLSLSFFMNGCENSRMQRSPIFPLKPPRHGDIYVIAHRGAHNGIPENSIPAYQKAIDLGADFVEVDIRTSSDGHFISIHNSTVDAYVVAPVWRKFSPELVNMSHDADALVFVDEQDKSSWPQALAWGADGIQTDHPAALIEFLKQRKPGSPTQSIPRPLGPTRP